MTHALEQLKHHLAEIGHIHRAIALLDWDQQTYMPPGGSQARAEQIGYLSGLAHARFVSDDTRRLLEAAEAETAGSDPHSDGARLVANARRDFDHAVKIPAELAAELAEHTSSSQQIWRTARQQKDFTPFAPALARTIDLVRRVADLLGYPDEPYDALLDEYEPGMRAADVDAIFQKLKPALVDLVKERGEETQPGTPNPFQGTYPAADQHRLTLRVVEAMGYDLSRGRQDIAAHPFCTNFSRDDVRITTRFDESRPDYALYSSMHEAGHALYEQGIPQEYDNTPLGSAASMGFHESQSRMWENFVGRSREFIHWIWPLLSDTFPSGLAGWTPDRFHAEVNRVQPSLIRVEADEVTYNLHILLRFELERELLNNRLKVQDLPRAWNDRMEAYLGIVPPNDGDGVLQDIHWSAALIGYFPTYTLGNLIAGQLWHHIQKSIPNLPEQIAKGEFAPLLQWLRTNVHRYGRKYQPAELLERITGEPLSPDYLVRHLRAQR
ncbi:MAG: carboxypeptidase M32 [Chthonomonadales bacterium]